MPRGAVVLPLNTWRTIVKDRNTRHAFDEMFVSIEAVINDLQQQIDDIVDGEVDPAHTLLQDDIHTDTITNAPSPGSLVKGLAGSAADFTPYWIDGAVIAVLPTETDTTGVKYWLDGLPIISISGLTAGGDTKWTEHVIGPVGTVLTSTGSDVEWSDLAEMSVTTHPSGVVAVTVTPEITPINSSSWQDITGLTVTATVAGRCLVYVRVGGIGRVGGGDVGCELQLVRNGSVTVATLVSGVVGFPVGGMFADDPDAGTHTYTVQIRRIGGDPGYVYINDSVSGSVVDNSSLVAIPIGAV